MDVGRDRPTTPGEPTPWALGLALLVVVAVTCAVIVVGVYDVVAQQNRLLGIAAVLVVCAGITPTAWVWRTRPVLRWISAGSMVGVTVSVVSSVVIAGVGVH